MIKFNLFSIKAGRNGDHRGIYLCSSCGEYETFTGCVCDGCGVKDCS